MRAVTLKAPVVSVCAVPRSEPAGRSTRCTEALGSKLDPLMVNDAPACGVVVLTERVEQVVAG